MHQAKTADSNDTSAGGLRDAPFFRRPELWGSLAIVVMVLLNVIFW